MICCSFSLTLPPLLSRPRAMVVALSFAVLGTAFLPSNTAAQTVLYNGESAGRPLASGLHWVHPSNRPGGDGVALSETAAAARTGANGLRLDAAWLAGNYGFSFGWNFANWNAANVVAATPATTTLELWVRGNKSYPNANLRIALRDLANLRTAELIPTDAHLSGGVTTSWKALRVPLAALQPPTGFNWAQLVELNLAVIAQGGQAGDIILDIDDIALTVAPSQSPFGGTARAVPGRIQAEDFDTGGQNVAYNDLDSSNNGNQYRATEGVDIEVTTDTGGGYNVGWIRSGEWIEHTVAIQQSGSYTVRVRTARQPTGTASLRVTAQQEDALTNIGTFEIPSTGGWQTWTTVTRTGINLPGGTHVLRIEALADNFNLNWIEFERETGSTTAGPGTGSGLAASYFNNTALTAPAALTRTDATVDFDWGSGAPAPAVGVDNFSVRWTGQVEAPASGNYSFQTQSDDGVRVWLSGSQIINNWTDHAPTLNTSAAISLTAGTKYDVVMEYYERGGGAVARLRWIVPGSSTAVAIPTARLYPGTSAPTSLVCNKVRFFPRAGQAGRMLNGRFTGSNSGETTDFVELVRISTTPAEGQWTELTFSNTQVYRWVKYEAPNGSFGNVAEVEFYNDAARLVGTGFGTAGSQNNSGNTFAKALDGDTATYFDSPNADGAYVGIDLGANSQVAAVSFTPAPGSYSSAQTVTLTSATAGATIRYRTDGGTPTATSGTVYSSPITVSANTTIAAIAIKSGLANSAVTLGSYTISSTPPTSGPRKTYHIGNSLTDTINGWLGPVAQSAGFTHTYMRFTIPGAGIKWLWEHPATGFGTPSYANDYRVVFSQDVLTDMFLQPFPNPPGFDNDAINGKNFIDGLYGRSPNAQVWLYGQWPSRTQSSWSTDAHCVGAGWMSPPWTPTRHPNPTNWDQALLNKFEYYETLRTRMDNENGGKPILIVPGGLAMLELKRRSELGQIPGMNNILQDIFSDDLHLNAKGQYLIALTHFACIYRTTPEGKVTSANTGLTAQQATLFQQIAWDVVRTYAFSGVTP